MILVPFVLLLAGGPSVEELDRLATARDVVGISKYVSNLPDPNPLDVLKTNGPYQVGSFGWHARGLRSPDGETYVVLTTPLTSEDVGEVLFRRDGDRLRWIQEDDPMNVQVLGHTFDLRFEVSRKAVQIVDRLRFRSQGTGDFAFRMGDEYRVSSITDETGGNVPFAQAGGTVLVEKPKAGEAVYRVVYGGVVDRPQYAGSISSTEATLANEYWYPMVAREPAPYEVTAHAPKGWTIVGQGDRLSDRDLADEHEATFRMVLPVVYFSLSAGPYKSRSIVQDGRTFTCWSPRMSPPRMEAQAETYAPIIKFYERFGRFPFAGYGGLDSPNYGGGALEAYSYATYGSGFLPDEDAHEPSHTWWGGIIDNTYLHSFWNESFADYSDQLYRREGAPGNREERRSAFVLDGGTGNGYDRFACAKAGADRGGVANSLGYGKGSQVLGMLEQIMGTDSMIGAMHRWIADQPRGKPGEWEDFEHAAEKERPDLHLETFFADWLDRPGHVDFDARVGYEGGELNIDLKFNGKPFRIPLEVLLGYADGTRKMVRFDVSESKLLQVPSAQKPSFVSLDPYLRLVRRIANDELPTRLERSPKSSAYVEEKHSDWAPTISAGATNGLPSDPAGAVLIGSPETSPLMADLCKTVGFSVTGNSLTYDGTRIDLDHGAAMAVVDLPNGKQCVISLGKTRIRPNPGHARLALFDDLGRFLRGRTDPKTSGHLTFKL